MPRNRKDLGFDLTHAEAAMAAFVDRVIRDELVCTKLYAAGLTPGLIYSFKKKKQRGFSAAKLITALAACEDLEVIVEGREVEDSQAPRWTIRAYRESRTSPTQDPPVRRETGQVSNRGLVQEPAVSELPGPKRPIQLSLFSWFQTAESMEIEVYNAQVTRKEPSRTEVRMDFVLKPRSAG